MNKWKCTMCGYLHEGDRPPDICPVCGAHKFQFILYEPLPDALEKKLREAFAGESKAFMRNLAFAKKAEEDGFPQVALLFRAVADAEKVHADEYLKYLEGVIGETEENLKAAFKSVTPSSIRTPWRLCSKSAPSNTTSARSAGISSMGSCLKPVRSAGPGKRTLRRFLEDG
ncbi:MAG: Rubrerythrin [Deltaproteobacteria bacterium]|nr:Rubrerythrin [Deltaproteobacteria bacterium]